MSYREAKALVTLLAEINRLAPRRSKRSDGWIGDARHRKGWESSDHNPWLNDVVRARDFTHDPKGGLDCNKLATALVRMLGKHPALGNGAYIIWNRRIISTSRLREGWRPYKGINAHSQHLHVSVSTNPSGYDSTRAWGIAAAFGQVVARPVAAVKRVLEVARLRAASRKPGQSVAPTPVRMVQLWLAQLGYDPGPADGIWGKRTQAAFKAFQRDRGYKGRALNGLPGYWSVRTLAAAARSVWKVA